MRPVFLAQNLVPESLRFAIPYHASPERACPSYGWSDGQCPTAEPGGEFECSAYLDGSDFRVSLTREGSCLESKLLGLEGDPSLTA